ncbi:hypothetical protein G7Y79_00028g062340 [Physcia stellaris]|nr:hypothetical protein G7Y79_00028g062340 [Physcia stellaris]
MQFLLQSLLLSNLVLECFVSARPTTLPRPDFDVTSSITASNDSLLHSTNPRGPAEFDMTTLHGYRPLRREACYMSAVRLLATQINEDFEGLVPVQKAEYTDPQYPDLTIEMSSLRFGRLVPRKFLFWGLARIMHQMTIDNSFVDSWYELTWQGSPVGEILFNAVPARAQLESNHINKTRTRSAMDHSNVMMGSTGPEGLSFEYTLVTEQLLIGRDVFMGTIGALIQLAQTPHRAFTRFAGVFPGEPGVFPTYNAQIYWTNAYLHHPLALTKFVIAESMVAAVTYGLGKGDFHGLAVLVKNNNGQEIARGGYLALGSPPRGERNAASS